MSAISRLCLVGLSSTLLAGVSHAQPAVGAVVRVKIAENVAVVGDTGATVVGEMVSRDSSGLVVHRFDPPISIRIPIATIAHAEYLRETGRDKGRTVGTAVLIGALAGGAVGYASGKPSNDCMVLCSASGMAMVGGAVGALVGLVVGIPVAAATGDRWVPFDPADVSVSAAVVPLGRGVGLAFRWTP